MSEGKRATYDNFLPEAQLTQMPEITVPRSPFITNLGHRFCNFGSCFAQNIKSITDRFGFDSFFVAEICAHYTTETIAQALEFAASGAQPGPEHLYFFEDRVQAYRNHFKLSYHETLSPALLLNLAGLYEALRVSIREADTFIVTLGTSRTTRLTANGRALAAVSGLPRDHWRLDDELLSVEKNSDYLRRACAALATLRGGRPANLVLTVSPQRYLFGHLLEGGERHEGIALVDNFLSKCNLRVAVQDLLERPPAGFNVLYFPAFEIVYEELRNVESLAHNDYCHISQQYTPELVVKKFLRTYASDAVLKALSEATEISTLWYEVGRMRLGALPVNDSRIGAAVEEIEARLDRLGDDISAPLLNIRWGICAQFQRRLPKLFRDYPFHGPGNLVADARILASLGRIDEARMVVQSVIARLGPRRTQDPDAGPSQEHHIYNEAVAVWHSLAQAQPANNAVQQAVAL